MATIATTTNTAPFIYPPTTLFDRDPTTGNLLAMVKSSTANVYQLYYSTNSGASWATYGAALTRANLTEAGGMFVGNDGLIYWCYRTNESSEDRVYFQRNAYGVWGGEVLVTSASNGGVAGAVYTGMDLHIAGSSGAIYVAVAVGYTSGASHGVRLFGVYIDTAAQASAMPGIIRSTNTWLNVGSGRITPSLDIEHTGDGKSSAQPNLWLTFGRTTLSMVKLAWSAGWTGPTFGVELASGISATDTTPGRWDGAQWVSAIPSSDTVKVYERNRANTSTTVRTTPTHPTGVVRNCGLSYNDVSRDIRVYAVGTSTGVLYFVDFVRATGLWTSWGTVSASTILGASVNNWGVRRGSFGRANHDVYYAVSGAPNTLTHAAQSLSYAPNTPTWLSPTTGSAQDVAASLLLDWVFSDPDAADVQSAYALSRQIGAGALAYFRASDSTWQATEQKNTSAVSERTLASSWAAGSDAAYSFKVKVWDSADTASAYSAAVVITPSVKVDPTFTAPGSGATITTDTVTITWTVSEQTQFRVTLSTNPGGVLSYDSGWMTSASTSHTPTLRLADLSGWTISLQTKNNEGLASTVVTRNFSVDYLEPAVPTLAVAPIPRSGVIRVVVTNPAPSGGQPALSSQALYRRVVGSGAAIGARVAVGLASGATYDDWTAASRTAYEYRALASGVNGTSIYSAWTA